MSLGDNWNSRRIIDNARGLTLTLRMSQILLQFYRKRVVGLRVSGIYRNDKQKVF